MDLNKIYDIAENEKIDILEHKFKNKKAGTFKVQDNYYIGLDKTKIKTTVDEREVLAHELGHYYTGSLYDITANSTLISKQEYKAEKWMWKFLLPINKLEKVPYNSYFSTCEIADELGVSEQVLTNALEYYRNNKLLA